MLVFYRPTVRKRIAGLLLLLTISELVFPSLSYALTSGPSQPEFSSFEPVSTNQLVDEFTGDFTYNIPVISIPGPQGSDYPLSLSYHSGATSEEEASWVGYGWTLNPGAITRNTRGFPDDFNKAQVTYYNKMPANWTVTAGVGVGGLEAFSKDFSLGASYALRYNNYQGFGSNTNIGLSLGKGVVSLGYNSTDGMSSFSATVSPVAVLNRATDIYQAAKANINTQIGSNATATKAQPRAQGTRISLLGGNHGLLTYGDVNRSTHAASYTGGAMNVSVGLQINPIPFPVGATTNIFGSYSWQENVESQALNAYGYLYSQNSNATDNESDNAVRDYYTEKETAYNKRDNFLGMPFNNADIFAVSGEGVGGSFRLYHDKVGEFAPNYKASKIIIGNLSPELAVGTAFGAGSDFGAGWQQLSEGPWEKKVVDRKAFSSAAAEKDDVFFRFANDMGGGTSTAAVPDEPVAARVNRSDWQHPDKTKLAPQLEKAAVHNRASYIAYHTRGDVAKVQGYTTSLRLARRFSQRSDLPVDYLSLDPNAICEMAITTANGGRYLYGLPVLSAGENNLEYSILKDDIVNRNYLATVKVGANLDDREVKLGETRTTAYANSFPLTEIQSADYVDRTLNGPTADDFGGYTRFNYVKKYGRQGNNLVSANGYYNWRTPYNGLLYKTNSLSDPNDDLGAVSYGQKEIVYLRSVQTKTHTAIFVRTARSDGQDAGAENGYPGGSYPDKAEIPRERTGTENPRATAGYKGLYKLSRIDLYSNSDLEPSGDSLKPKAGVVPIKSVHFSYSYELFQGVEANKLGVPNSAVGAGDKRQGKLTLTRVWFEYQGIPTKISPYTFSYNYPDYASYPATYYGAVGARPIVSSAEDLANKNEVAYYDQLTPAVQNPVYDPLSLDAWGNYCNKGPERAQNMQPWLDQRDLFENNSPPSYEWDPAAWQLKGITLPTGGQIHVQYEQDDYAYVQNRPVHAMASLLSNVNKDDVFQVDADGLGLKEDAEKQATVDAINAQYKGTGRKIFFKFLYNLAGKNLPVLQPLTTNAEYITGYTSLKEARLTGGQVEIELEHPKDGYTLPIQVCKNFLLTQRAGKLGGNKFTGNKFAPMQAVRDLVAWKRIGFDLSNQCGALNPSLSYFRIPLVKPKKGGGLRVKRLLTFDKTGLDGAAVLYGSEYSYRMRADDGKIISSGVATTEPAAMREENILVDYLPRQGQNLLSKAVSGLDRKQAEGPLGESLLPAPSVGYARVVVRNIHSGRTSPGFSISEFATARDYPMQVQYTSLQNETQFRLIPAILFTDQLNNTYATQGYSFILNNMHGQVRRRATYPGNYPGHQLASSKLPAPTTEQKYVYFEPTQQANSTNAIQLVAEQSSPAQPLYYPGREVDMTMAQKAVKDNMVDVNFEADVDIAFLVFFPAFFSTVFPTVTRSQAELYTHVTTKVIRYPAVVKRIETTQDGIKHITENIAFDQISGQVVQTKENDEFKGGYVQEKVQAAWIRPEFEPKWERENKLVISATTAASGVSISLGAQNEIWLNFLPATSACDGLAKITRGDQLAISTQSNDGDNALYFADNPDFLNSRVRIYPAILPFSSPSTLTLPTGVGPNTPVSTVQIMTSGRMNQLTASAGATTYHGTDYTKLAVTMPFTTSKKYSSSSFSSAINSWLGTSTRATDKFSSGGTSYEHMNISAYANRLSPGCVPDPSDATISDVVVAKQTLNGKIRVSLVSFKVACASGGLVVTIENK
jgi:hypothetical protein